MVRLNLRAVEERVAPLGGREPYDREFIFDLLLAYGKPRGNVTRLRNGSLSVADDKTTEVAQKNVVYFKETTGDPLAVIDELKSSPTVVRYRTRFVIVTDYIELLAVDTKTGENLMIPIRDIDQHFTFFLPWAGMEKAQYVSRGARRRQGRRADGQALRRAPRRQPRTDRADPRPARPQRLLHPVAVLLLRRGHRDLQARASSQTRSAPTPRRTGQTSPTSSLRCSRPWTQRIPPRSPRIWRSFPYVNGRLFTNRLPKHAVPSFTKTARDLLIALGTLNWSEINPDIFGSMFQAVVNPDERSNLGQHYTSVPNILKTIEPLFLDALREQFDAGFDSVDKLEQLAHGARRSADASRSTRHLRHDRVRPAAQPGRECVLRARRGLRPSTVVLVQPSSAGSGRGDAARPSVRRRSGCR